MNFLIRHIGYDSASASTESPKEQHGLFFLHEAPNPDFDIVAVHGLGGHFEGTWTDNDSNKLWLRDFLPSQLEEAGILVRLMSYGYDSRTAFSKSVTDVEDQATMLMNALDLERQSPSETKRPLIFIAHSLGGIIVKKAMVIAYERSSIYGNVLRSVYAMVFFGVPHRGSDLAYWSTLAARLFGTISLGSRTNTSFVEALQRNSQIFADISQSFIERAAPLKIRTFYETEKLYGNLIVDKDSARLGLSNEIPVGVSAANHSTICKFNNKDSQRYRPVWKTIQALCVEMEGVTASTEIQPERLFIVPFPRDPLFLGRKEVIDVIDTKFESERRVALTGIGGVGKSQIAIEYCYRFRDQHPDSHVFWIYAGTKERFEQAFKAIARQRKLPGWDNPAVNALDIVCEWLSSSDNTWLIILDNADDKDVFFNQRPSAAAQSRHLQPSTVPLVQYLPQASCGGLMLITSRNSDAAFRLTNNVANLVDVPYMSKEDAVALLCKKLPDDRSRDDERVELVELLEYLPLAITQAASYISVKRTRMTIARYSHYLKDTEDILIDDMGDLRRDTTIPSSVLLTWHISFDQIRGENRSAADLLSLMSVFDRQGIPRYLLQGKDENDLDFERRLDPLEEFSLTAFGDGGESFQMHRLVQIAIKSWLERHREIDRWRQNAAELLKESLPGPEYHYWKTWEILLPHSEAVLQYVLPSPASQILHAEILHLTAKYFNERGKYNTAKERCQRALKIRTDLLGEDDVEVAYSLRLLAEANLGEKGGLDGMLKIDEIEAMNRRALDIFERMRGKEDSGSLAARNDLACTLLYTEKLEEAAEIFRSILALQGQAIELDEHIILMTRTNLAIALAKQHKYNEAETVWLEALVIQLRRLGENDPDTMCNMQNLANCLTQQENYEEAQDVAQCVLELRVSVLGEEHPDTLNSRYSLSCIFYHQGKYLEAEEQCRQAVATSETTFGEGSETTSQYTRMLREILRKQHRYSEVEDLCRHLMCTNKKHFGLDRFETKSDMVHLARILDLQNKHEQAEEFFREVYNKGPEPWYDSEWSSLVVDFARTLAKQGKHEEEEGLHRQLLDTRTTRLGLDHPLSRLNMANLASCLHNQAKYEQAEKFYWEVYNRWPEWWDDSDWDRLLAQYADTLAKQGKHDEAAEISRQRDLSEDEGSEMSET